MFGIRYAEGLKILPILGPVDAVATDKSTEYVDLKNMNWATFLCQFGSITTDVTDTITVTVEASTAQTSNAGEAAIAFKYRLSSAVATDSMGAITDATATGAVITGTDDNKLLIIDVDPAAVAFAEDTDRWLRVVLTTSSGVGASLMSVIFVGEPRYPGNSIPSST